MVREGVIAVDVGFHAVPDPATGATRFTGDLDFDSVAAKAEAVTPVPGGVGRSPTSGSWGTPWWPPRSRPTWNRASGRGPDLASAFGTTYRFELGAPGRAARWACLASAAILSITGIVAITRGASDAEWQVRLFLPPEGSSAQPAFSTFYPGAIGTVVWIGSLAFLATAVCWLVWQARAHENVWAVPGLPAPTRTPGMAVIWWFIPFANLVMPYVCA